MSDGDLTTDESAGAFARARHEELMGDPEYRAAYEKAEREIRQQDALGRGRFLIDPAVHENDQAWE